MRAHTWIVWQASCARISHRLFHPSARFQAKATTKPDWNQRIVMPVYTPCMANNVEVQIWDWSRLNPDELIASMQVEFSKLLTEPLGPIWVNFYGAPVNDSNGFWGWLGEVTPNLFGDVERDDTAYLGRVLLSLKVWPAFSSAFLSLLRSPPSLSRSLVRCCCRPS